jgi:hypothetical protein
MAFTCAFIAAIRRSGDLSIVHPTSADSEDVLLGDHAVKGRMVDGRCPFLRQPDHQNIKSSLPLTVTEEVLLGDHAGVDRGRVLRTRRHH